MRLLTSLAIAAVANGVLPTLALGILPEVKEDMEHFFKTRLAMYEPEDIRVVYGVSPRKIIKNVVVIGNGYYAVEFRSRKFYGMRFSCDATHVVGGGVRPGTYVYNCKSEADSAIFPTEVGRVFADQFPGKAKPGTVRAISAPLVTSLSTVFLFDYNGYRLEYEATDRPEIVQCYAFMDLVLNPSSLVDQKLELSNCVSRPVRRPHYEPTAIQADCEWVRNTLPIAGNLSGKFYDHYAKALDSFRPLPESAEANCRNFAYWQDYAEAMISLDGVKLKSASAPQRSRELAVLENALITQAYNRLITKSVELQAGKLPATLQWLTDAAQNSALAGKLLRKDFEKWRRSLNPGAGYAAAIRRDGDFFREAGQGRDADQDLVKIARKSGEANRRVFLNSFWQHLAAAYCGPSAVHQMLESMRNKSTSSDPNQRRYGGMLSIWYDIAAGASNTPPSELALRNGNSLLQRIDNRDFLQRDLFESLTDREAKRLLALQTALKPKTKDVADIPVRSFSEFAKANRIPDDFKNDDARGGWLAEVAGERTKGLERAAANGQLKTELLDSLVESYNLLFDYVGEKPSPKGKTP